MTFKRQTSHLLTGMLLIVLMGVTFALPSGMHLQFCFGDDGHFDVGLNSCPDAPLPVRHDSTLSLQTHHDSDCLDFTVVCDSSEKLVRQSEKFSQLKTKIKHIPSQASGFIAGAFSARAPLLRHPTSSLFAHQSSPSLPLASLRTIVLLI